MHTYPLTARPSDRRDHLRDFILWFLGTSFALSLLPALPLLVTNPSRQEFADYYLDEKAAHYPQYRDSPIFQSTISLGKTMLALRTDTLNFGVGTVFFTPPDTNSDRAIVLGFAHCFLPLHQPASRG